MYAFPGLNSSPSRDLLLTTDPESRSLHRVALHWVLERALVVRTFNTLKLHLSRFDVTI